MQCANCKNHVNSGATVCPYCHRNPYFLSANPFLTGVDGTPGANDGSGCLVIAFILVVIWIFFSSYLIGPLIAIRDGIWRFFN